MEGTRAFGLSHLYLDKQIEGFSNVSVGLLTRSIGHGLKVAYVDCDSKARKFTNFLENLSLSREFVKSLDRFWMDIFVFKGNNRVTKTFLPQVEFHTILEDMFWKSLNKYDLIVFDNASFEKISKFKIINFLNNKPNNLEVVFTFSEEKEFEEIKENFDLVTKYDYKENTLFGKNKNILNITGDGKGKSTYSFGYLIRNFINKEDVKLVYFDKGGNFYGERNFFKPLKKWSKTQNFYGSFDYVATGLERFDGKTFRFDNKPEDIKEAKEGLMLLKTSLKKQTPVIAEELNTTIKTGLLELDEVLEVLSNIKNQVVLTGRYSPKEFLDISNVIIEAKEIKHYVTKGNGVRKGIDF